MESLRPPVEYLAEALELQVGGKLVWRVRPPAHFSTVKGMRIFNTQYSGKPAGQILFPHKNYRVVWITFQGRRHQIMEHIVVWALSYGEYPDGEIDHEDGNGFNNCPTNFRLTDRTGNMHNKKQYKNNSSGHVGVSWYPKSGKWVAQGTHNKVKKTLGYFVELADAVAAREAWEAGKGFSERHGKTCDKHGNPLE